LFFLHGWSNLFARVGIETLAGGGSWFSQSIREGALHPTAFGQVEQNHQCARINWLLNCDEQNESPLLHLIDNLSFEAGLHGAKYLLANACQDSDLFSSFRRAGFCVYGWERFWRVNPITSNMSTSPKQRWERPVSKDLHEIVKFRNKHLPPAARSISVLDGQSLPDYVLRNDHAITAYASLHAFGNRGILYPVLGEELVHPKEALLSLISELPEIISTCYIAQTANQGWLDESLSEISEPAASRKEKLVKYFSIMEKVPLGVLNRASEGSHPDPVAPYIHSSKL
jgi:hypothetical protein